MLIGGAEPQPNRVLLGSVRRDLPHHLADGGDAVVGDAAGDAVAGHHGAAGVDHLPLHRERLTRPVIVVHHVHCLAQSGAGGFALQVGPLHHHVQRTKRLPERIPSLLLLAVVVHHRRGDRRPAVLEVEEQAAVAGIELVPAVELDVVLVQERLVVLAVVDQLLQAVRLGNPAQQDVAVQAAPLQRLPVERPPFLLRQEAAQRFQVRQRLRRPELADELQQVALLDRQIGHRAARRPLGVGQGAKRLDQVVHVGREPAAQQVVVDRPVVLLPGDLPLPHARALLQEPGGSSSAARSPAPGTASRSSRCSAARLAPR